MAKSIMEEILNKPICYLDNVDKQILDDYLLRKDYVCLTKKY